MKWVIIIVLVILAGVAVGLTFQIDQDVRDAVVESQGNKKKWRKTADYAFHSSVRKYGDWPWIMLAAGIGTFVAWKSGSKRWTRILIAAMLASTVAGIIVNASRLTTGRTRPRASPKIEQGFYGPWHEGKILIGNSAYNSFPSGHTATAFGFAVPIAVACPVAGLVAVPAAGVVAWSSIAMGAHHPSDILVSILISIPVGWLCWVFVRDRGTDVWEMIRKEIAKRRRPKP